MQSETGQGARRASGTGIAPIESRSAQRLQSPWAFHGRVARDRPPFSASGVIVVSLVETDSVSQRSLFVCVPSVKTSSPSIRTGWEAARKRCRQRLLGADHLQGLSDRTSIVNDKRRGDD